MGSIISSDDKNTLAQYSQRFHISNHPLFQNQNIKILHQKLTSNIFLLSILSASDYSTKQQYQRLINQKLAIKPSTITPIQHYFQQTNTNACSQFYKIYVLFGLKKMITLKQYALTQKLSKKNISYKKLDYGINSLLLAINYLKYLNQPHSNINATTIMVDNQDFLLVDPWISQFKHIQSYPSPQKLDKINNFSQSFDQYANDIFAIGMTFLQILSQSNIQKVYKKNNKIDIKQLQAFFNQVKQSRENILLNPQNMYISSLIHKLNIILFQGQKQRLKMLQTFQDFNKANLQIGSRINTKGIKKTLNQLRNISSQVQENDKNIFSSHKQTYKNCNNYKTDQAFITKPKIDTKLLNQLDWKKSEFQKCNQTQNIKLQKINFSKAKSNPKIYQKNYQNYQLHKVSDSQATVKVIRQYEKTVQNNEMKKKPLVQNPKVIINNNTTIFNKYGQKDFNINFNPIQQSEKYNQNKITYVPKINFQLRKQFINTDFTKRTMPQVNRFSSFNQINYLQNFKNVEKIYKTNQYNDFTQNSNYQKYKDQINQNYYPVASNFIQLNKYNKLTKEKQFDKILTSTQTVHTKVVQSKIDNRNQSSNNFLNKYLQSREECHSYVQKLLNVEPINKYEGQIQAKAQFNQSNQKTTNASRLQIKNQNPINKKSIWKKALKQSLNSSNIQFQGIQTTQSIIEPFSLSSQNTSVTAHINNKKQLSKFSKKYKARVAFSEPVAQQVQNQQQFTNQQGQQIEKQLQFGLQSKKNGQQNQIKENESLSYFEQKSSFQIPQVERKIINLNKQQRKEQIQFCSPNLILQTNYKNNGTKEQVSTQKIQKKSGLSPESIFSVDSSQSKTSKIIKDSCQLQSKLESIQNELNQAMGLACHNFFNYSKKQLENAQIHIVQNSQNNKEKCENSNLIQNLSTINNKELLNKENSNQLLKNQRKETQNHSLEEYRQKDADKKKLYYEISKFQIDFVDKDQLNKILNSENQSAKSQNITVIHRLKSDQQDDFIKEQKQIMIKEDDQISILSQQKVKSEKNKNSGIFQYDQIAKSDKLIQINQQQKIKQNQKQGNKLAPSLHKHNQFAQQLNKKYFTQRPLENIELLRSNNNDQIIIQEEVNNFSSINNQEQEFPQQNNFQIENQQCSDTSNKLTDKKNEEVYYTPSKLEYQNFPELISRTIPEQQQEGSLNGSFQNQNPQPFGDYVQQQYQNGGKYCGYMFNSMRNGHGKFFYKDGGYYDGFWKNNKMNGYGKLYYDNGKLAYEGQWYKDQFHGRGKVYNDNAEQLLSHYDYRNFQNIEQYWQFYQGQLSHDTKVGYGKIKLSNGQIFSGTFVNDKAHGLGKFTTLDGYIIKGIWHQGKLLKQISRQKQRNSHFQSNFQAQQDVLRSTQNMLSQNFETDLKNQSNQKNIKYFDLNHFY